MKVKNSLKTAKLRERGDTAVALRCVDGRAAHSGMLMVQEVHRALARHGDPERLDTVGPRGFVAWVHLCQRSSPGESHGAVVPKSAQRDSGRFVYRARP